MDADVMPGRVYLAEFRTDLTSPKLAELLRVSFEPYGKLSEVNVSPNLQKRGTRGFGFLQFKCESAAAHVLPLPGTQFRQLSADGFGIAIQPAKVKKETGATGHCPTGVMASRITGAQGHGCGARLQDGVRSTYLGGQNQDSQSSFNQQYTSALNRTTTSKTAVATSHSDLKATAAEEVARKEELNLDTSPERYQAALEEREQLEKRVAVRGGELEKEEAKLVGAEARLESSRQRVAALKGSTEALDGELQQQQAGIEERQKRVAALKGSTEALDGELLGHEAGREESRRSFDMLDVRHMAATAVKGCGGSDIGGKFEEGIQSASWSPFSAEPTACVPSTADFVKSNSRRRHSKEPPPCSSKAARGGASADAPSAARKSHHKQLRAIRASDGAWEVVLQSQSDSSVSDLLMGKPETEHGMSLEPVHGQRLIAWSSCVD